MGELKRNPYHYTKKTIVVKPFLYLNFGIIPLPSAI